MSGEPALIVGERAPVEAPPRRALASWFGRMIGEFRIAPVRTARALGADRRIVVGRGFRIVGATRIHGRLNAGLMYFGTVDPRERGLIRVLGRLDCTGRVDVAHGNRWYIGSDAVVRIGGGTYFSPNASIVALNRVTVGNDCAIGWETQILDDNHHPLVVEGRESVRAGEVAIGRHVWIGSRVTILKDTVIADDCVVAAGSIVKGRFEEPGSLIGGNPAKVIRRHVTWRA
jgi:acetyltransferase-like isoleucine patch superfamily enzyme